MFYGQCNTCGQRWELGTASTCTCKDEEMKIHLSEKEFLEAEIKRLEHNETVLMNALFKACGDDAQVVKQTIESQGELT